MRVTGEILSSILPEGRTIETGWAVGNPPPCYDWLVELLKLPPGTKITDVAKHQHPFINDFVFTVEHPDFIEADDDGPLPEVQAMYRRGDDGNAVFVQYEIAK